MLTNTCLHSSLCPQLQHFICLEYDLIKRETQRSAVPFHCFSWKLSVQSLLWHWLEKTSGFLCLAFAISGGGIFCHMWGANKGCKSLFRTLIYKIFTLQSYRSSVKLQMKWKVFCDNRHNSKAIGLGDLCTLFCVLQEMITCIKWRIFSSFLRQLYEFYFIEIMVIALSLFMFSPKNTSSNITGDMLFCTLYFTTI